MTTPHNIIRAWKDEQYRGSLSAAEKHLLPPNPAGLIELSDAQLSGIEGGDDTLTVVSISVTIETITWCPCDDNTTITVTLPICC
jgi:mersacidin/lichenicidin family type 2 lantibiotic